MNDTAFPQPSGFDFFGDPYEIQEQNGEALAAAALVQKEQAKRIHAAMSSDAGLAFLDWLKSCTVDVPLMDVSGSLVRGEVALSPAEWAYVREGQNSVFREIVRQMEIAVSPEPNAEKGEENE